MRDARLAATAKDHAAHLGAKKLGVLAAAQELDDLVIGVQVLDHNERLVGAQRKETRKVHGAIGATLIACMLMPFSVIRLIRRSPCLPSKAFSSLKIW